MMVKYLVMVDPTGNHNKVYCMRQIDQNSFEASWGRVGALSLAKRIYPMSVWDKTLNSKLNKGYCDETASRNCIPSQSSDKWKPISEPRVRAFWRDIESYAKHILQQNYSVNPNQVTPEMIRAAEEILRKIDANLSVSTFNELLLNLFHVLPRRMKQVNDYLAESRFDMQNIINREYNLLNVFSAQVGNMSAAAQSGNNVTVLDHLGLSIEPVVAGSKTEREIIRHMGNESKRFFSQAFRVRNKATDDRFYSFMADNGYSESDIHYLYHGSRNENWYGLMKRGPLLAPKNVIITGKMFGNGLYFANRAKKSIGYSSLSGSVWANGDSKKAYLGVYKVLYKDADHTKIRKTYSLESLVRNHKDAVFAEKGIDLINDEIIIFRESQVTLQYIIELKI